MSFDVWVHLNSLNTVEGWRCRYCRGCKYFGSVGAYGCCNYLLIAGSRRKNKFGVRDCGAKEMIAGYRLSEKHKKYCEGQPPESVLAIEKREREAERRLAKQKEKKRIPIYDKYQAPPGTRGRRATWDTEYAAKLYQRGFYIYEIAEIVGVKFQRVNEYSLYNKWSQKYRDRKPPTRHDLRQAKEEYEQYKAEKEKDPYYDD